MTGLDDVDAVTGGAGVRLRGGRLLVDGTERGRLTRLSSGMWQGGDDRYACRLEVASEAPDGRGGRLDEAVRMVLSVDLGGAPPPARVGVRFDVSGAARGLRMGYHSWDGSGVLDLPVPGTTPGADDGAPAGPQPAGTEPAWVSYGLTGLAGPRGWLLVGAVRHDRFQHELSVRVVDGTVVLDVETLWDHAAAPGGTVTTEELLVRSGARCEPLLREWAHTVADASMRAGSPPRLGEHITGWSSWYHLYASIDETVLRQQLAGVVAARDDGLPMTVFQVDDGFTPEMGDWLDVRPQFPHGMRPVLDAARQAGLTPGLWIAPFLVGNRSRLYAEHPDWVVVDRLTSRPYVCMEFYGEFRWHKRSEEYYVLDTTRPEALAHLTDVLRTWRTQWGCEYVKTDFMLHAVAHGPDRFVRHEEGRSRVDIFREALAAIREAVGDATWLGCGIPLWMGIGLVDAVRIGRDAGVRWDGEIRGDARLQSLAARTFANGVLWQADPDCVLLRERFHYLSDAELRSSAWAAAMTGGVLMTSDDVAELSPARRRMWAELLSLGPGRCAYPLLGDPAYGDLLVQVREEPDGTLVHAVNLHDETREVRLDLGLLLERLGPDLRGSCVGVHGAPIEVSGSVVSATVGSHAGVLVRVSRG